MSVDRKLNWHDLMHSPLHLHIAAVAALAFLGGTLFIRVVLGWTISDTRTSAVLASRQAQLAGLTSEVTPLRGLNKHVSWTRDRILTFYSDRIPRSYSLVAARVGELGMGSGVRVSGIRYSQGSPGIDLTEVSMEASISGDYPKIMRFVNGLERDRLFFIIRAMELTGEDSGTVKMKLRVSTWLRVAEAAASAAPATPRPAGAVADTASQAERGR